MSHPDLHPALHAEQVSLAASRAWRRGATAAAVGGGIAVAGSFALGAGSARQLLFSWLVAFLFWLSLALGALFFVLTHFVTKARWSVVVRRLAENVMIALPLFALLFLPIFLGRGELYHWTHADAVAHDALLQAKRAYLNVGFFTLRAVVYFAVWSALAIGFARASRRQDHSGDEAITRRLVRTSAPCLFLFAITVSFAAIDWIMSLDPHWYSTMFGVYYFAGCLVGAFALLAILAVALRAGPLEQVVTPEHFHDLGKLLFAFTVFWAYIAFSQYFLIWYANVPEETTWYLQRMNGGWRSLSVLLAVGHFAVPFLFLMSRAIKRRGPLLVLGASWMLLMHFVDLYWLVMPTLHEDVSPSLLDLTTFLGIGGTCAGLVGWRMARGPLVPLRDPRLPDSLTFENV